MKLTFAALAVAALIAADSAREQANQRELQELAGLWVLKRTEFSDGGVQVGQALTLAIEPDGAARIISPEEDSPASPVSHFQLDPTTNPKQYKLLMEENGKKVTKLGVYELEGETFRLCYLNDAGKRPSRISAQKDKGGGDIVLIYRRRK
jgi:uncharacterized protein (TIGR03067 family)